MARSLLLLAINCAKPCQYLYCAVLCPSWTAVKPADTIHILECDCLFNLMHSSIGAPYVTEQTGSWDAVQNEHGVRYNDGI